MWKRTIDGLDALLGRTYPDREWNPQDGRIVRLGLHARTDQSLGHDVEATIWAQRADIDSPELRWFALMDEVERAAYAVAHQATVRRAARSGRSSAGFPMNASPASPRPRRRGRPRGQIPAGVTELTTEEAFDDAIAADDLMLKTDTAGPPKIHTRPARCSGITKEHFRAKVIIGGGKNGRYFTITDPAAVKQRWSRVVVCGVCKRLDPTRARDVATAITAGEDPQSPTASDAAP
jgi:hypothetical protein